MGIAPTPRPDAARRPAHTPSHRGSRGAGEAPAHHRPPRRHSASQLCRIQARGAAAGLHHAAGRAPNPVNATSRTGSVSLVPFTESLSALADWRATRDDHRRRHRLTGHGA